VEGFVVKYGNGDAYSKYPIKNSQAHAWAEAYINGIGWIPFEATSSYYDCRYTKWAEETNSSSVQNNKSQYSYDYYSKDLKNSHAGSEAVIKTK
jgi:hypothetical protein